MTSSALVNLLRDPFPKRRIVSTLKQEAKPSKSGKKIRAQGSGGNGYWVWHICFGLFWSTCSYIVYIKISPQRIRKDRFMEPDVRQHFYRCGSAAERTCCTRDGVSSYVININYHPTLQRLVKQTCAIWVGLLAYKETLIHLGSM